jgi:hypothetical protein
MDSVLPHRINPRIDNALAMCTKSSVVTDDPKRDIPYTEITVPNLRKLRSEMQLPTDQISSNERPVPSLEMPYIDKVLPSLITERTEIELPILRKSSIEALLLRRLKP